MPFSTRAPRTAPPVRGGAAEPMPRDQQRRRRPTPRRALLLLAAPLLVLGLAACEPSPQQDAVRRHVNDSRQEHQAHALGDDLLVRHKAQRWAEHLAASGSLAHSTLSSGLDGVPWVSVAENVGRGSSITSVHESFMASPRHRGNILDRRWDRVGTGHAVGRDGRVYVVQVFVDLG